MNNKYDFCTQLDNTIESEYDCVVVVQCDNLACIVTYFDLYFGHFLISI